MKPATKAMDAKIWKLWEEGAAPKDIKRILELSSTWAVYHGLRRQRSRLGLDEKPKTKKTLPKRAKLRQRRNRRTRVN